MLVEALAETLARQATTAALEAALARDAPDAPADELAELAGLLDRYLNGLPAAVAALTSMTKDPRGGRSAAFAAGQVLVYLVDEDDLLAESEFGPIGLLDDAYLVHGCVAALRSAFPHTVPPAIYEAPDARTVAAVRALLPAGVADALDRTCENLVRVAAALFAGGGEQAAGDQPSVRLRIGEALAALGAAVGSS